MRFLIQTYSTSLQYVVKLSSSKHSIKCSCRFLYQANVQSISSKFNNFINDLYSMAFCLDKSMFQTTSFNIF